MVNAQILFAPPEVHIIEVVPLIIGIIALVIVFLIYRWIIKQPSGNEKMREIASYIEHASWAFIKREWKTISIFIIILSILFALFIEKEGIFVAITFILGSLASLGAISFGMLAATKANVRTTEAARRSPDLALVVAFRGGAITGLGIVALSITLISILYLVLGRTSVELLHAITGFGVGASLSALFAQLGGGIYTKSADVGADLTGKVVLGLPEDDPRNPAVIADLTGDIVGDCAGRGSDLFESFSDNIIGGMLLGILFYFWLGWYAILLPLLLQSIGVIASIVGIISIGRSKAPTRRVFLSFVTTAIIVIIGFVLVGYVIPKSLPESLVKPPGIEQVIDIDKIGLVLVISGSLGLVISLLVAAIVIYYTSPEGGPVKQIAMDSEKGAAINLIRGMGYGLESGGVPIFVVAVISVIAFIIGRSITGYDWGGIFAIASAAMGILSTTGIIQSADSFGPIADNADGIADMSGISEETKKTTDLLDAVGNVTKQITKAYAMCCAVLTTFLLLFAFLAELIYLKGVEILGGEADLSKLLTWNLSELAESMIRAEIISGILHPFTIVGVILGAVVPYIFSAWAIRAVADGAGEVVKEVKFQVDKYKILEGGKPNYARCVDIVTKYGLKRMIAPTLLGLIVPPLIGFILGVGALIAYLISVNAMSAVLATFMFNAGGAWDNAKKVAKEMFGSGTEAHKAAIIGDTVGDPLKDTAGPSLHILIKLESILAITLLPLLL